MDPNRNRNGNNNNNNGNNVGYWATAAAVGAAAAGGLYWLLSSKEKKDKPHTSQQARQRMEREAERDETDSNLSGYFTDMLRLMSTRVSPITPQAFIPENPVITNLNGLLHDIYVRHIALKDDDFEKYFTVFMDVFSRLQQRMKEADPYYNQYSSTIQFAGSHYDRLRINKPDEFDMDIIIRLPVNLLEDPINPSKSDVVLEPKVPGFIQLKMGDQFKNLPNRDGVSWQINKTAYKWLDERNYLLRSKFIDWFRSVVDQAFNRFDMNANGRRFTYVAGIPYTLRLSSSGPAITLIIENLSLGFKLDVDLVPALKFPEKRWPICRGYKKIPVGCEKEFFMVVPKPNKAGLNRFDTERSWRLALHLQERQMLHDTNHLRQAIRLIKKLRDSQEMGKIASYYIKTLFFLEVERIGDARFWSQNNPTVLFTIMVRRFHSALVEGNIPYFWNRDNNLIGHIDRGTLTGYANKLHRFIQVLEDHSQYKTVAKFLLTPSEFEEYNRKFLHI